MSITEKRLIEILDQHKKEIIQSFEKRLEILSLELKDTQNTLSITYDMVINNEKEILTLKNQLISLQNDIKHVKENNKNFKQTQESLDLKIEDQTNRSMRNTLIFRGIKEDLNENWPTTENKLIKVLIDHAKIHPQKAVRMVERAHRGKKTHNNSPAHIFAKFYDWKDSQYVIQAFQSTNKSKYMGMNVFVNQMYSPTLTARRNDALLTRKQLKASKEIISGYIAYPATLMIKKNVKDVEYVKFKDF
jgi:hypothetical protein